PLGCRASPRPGPADASPAGPATKRDSGDPPPPKQAAFYSAQWRWRAKQRLWARGRPGIHGSSVPGKRSAVAHRWGYSSATREVTQLTLTARTLFRYGTWAIPLLIIGQFVLAGMGIFSLLGPNPDAKG